MENLSLKDIEGIHAVAWWPPAPGWVALCVCLLAIAATVIWRKIRRSQAPVFVHTPQDASLYSRAVILAENTRRYALACGKRHEVAGLRGTEWLLWLRAQDIQDFPWDMQALWLNDVGYAPEETIRLSEQEVAAAEHALRRMATMK